jgi:hypothetical protein
MRIWMPAALALTLWGCDSKPAPTAAAPPPAELRHESPAYSATVKIDDV